MLQDLFLDLFQSYDFILEDDMPNGNRLLFNRILNKEASESDIRESLKVLAKLLATHYKKEVMILIDEYDVPLDKAERNGYYDEMLSFLSTLFSSVLKDNPNVRKSILTGCLRISKESLFTGLNNLSVCSIASHRYSTSFGFTESEVDQLLIDMGFEDKKSIIRKWYDGYRIGDTMIYAPWDVLSYLRDIQLDCNALPNNYWANTSNNEIIRRLIDETGSSISNDYSTLINGDAIAKRITENITYNEILAIVLFVIAGILLLTLIISPLKKWMYLEKKEENGIITYHRKKLSILPFMEWVFLGADLLLVILLALF